MSSVEQDGRKVVFSSELQGRDLSPAIASLYYATKAQDQNRVVLDMSGVTRAYPDFMVPIICDVKRHEVQGVGFEVVLPDDAAARRFFDSANYSVLLTGEGELNRASTGQNLPAIPFRDEDEQFEVVNLLAEWMLAVTVIDGREDLQAFEWAVAETTDNVITHSEAPFGGLAQATYFPAANSVQFVICDPGIGIPESLRQNASFHGLSDRDTLKHAIRESVTSKRATNQGNGLYGTYELARVSKGRFTLRSGHAMLYLDNQHKLVAREEKVPFNGTLVVCSLLLGNENLIQEALRIKGKAHEISYDFLDQKADDDTGDIVLDLLAENTGFASRRKALPLRNKVANYLRTTDRRVVVDFQGVSVVSSSFADEFIAKLVDEFGPMVFMSRVSIRNANATVASLIDRAMLLRLSGNGAASE